MNYINTTKYHFYMQYYNITMKYIINICDNKCNKINAKYLLRKKTPKLVVCSVSGQWLM